MSYQWINEGVQREAHRENRHMRGRQLATRSDASRGERRLLSPLALVLLLVAAVLAAHTGTASAEKLPGDYPSGADYSGVFQFALRGEASDGFKFLISGYSNRSQTVDDRAALDLYRPPPGRRKGGESVRYIQVRARNVRARLDSLAFTLGRFGNVNLRFKVRRERSLRDDVCQGNLIVRRGTYTGVIKHESEGFADMPRRLRLDGVMNIDRQYNCFANRRARPISPAEEVELGACVRGEYDFFVQREAGRNGPDFVVLAPLERYREQGVIVDRNIFSRGGGFEVAPDLSSAALDPPPPYTGAASYAEESGNRGLLSGDLGFQLPGRPFSPLDGRAAELTRTKDAYCDFAPLGEDTASSFNSHSRERSGFARTVVPGGTLQFGGPPKATH